ncbi:fungal-specific transcription factor domain-containing protein [Thelonectria olida]|uniref:Fungal-specific transcription factor domain-containing protein n=1 Tax=Thelonectria olida TaxID=1576542 RepID=A0A9P8WD22_9HYPO|nr:fungal-specific transcription factor domain-containing protein [Thelonectria olida]
MVECHDGIGTLTPLLKGNRKTQTEGSRARGRARRSPSANPFTANTSNKRNRPTLTSTPTICSCASKSSSPPKLQWEGIYAATARSEQTSYYGPSSAFYFIGKIGSFLGKTLHVSLHDGSMQPRGANKTLTSPTSADDAGVKTPHRSEAPRPSMPRVQEECFINLFWESHHLFTPIVNEGEFRRLYEELWQDARPYRKHCALVDIVLAITMQYGWAFLVHDSPRADAPTDDASIAGRWYYRRCQSLLAAELESPTLRMLQCHLLSVVWLCCASFQNMAHTALATAVRTAQILGLHLEPPASMPRSEREQRKRLWWSIYTIEAKTCMKLGRPFSVQKHQVTVSLPADDDEAAAFFGSSLGAYDAETTWLTYSVQTQKLIAATVDVYELLYDKCSEALGREGGSAVLKSPQALEECAKFLATKVHALESWVRQVPDGLKLKRRSDGTPFSVDRCPMVLDPSAPLWLRRGRICLELIYHTMLTNLYRPFINFTPSSSTYTPTADSHAAACAAHAVAHIQIMHQVLQETDLMNGWQEYFLWQWNATVTVIGFIMANPINPATASARKAVDMAVEVFEVYGSNFGVAASAAAVTRELIDKADLLSSRLRSGITAGATSAPGPAQDIMSDGGLQNLENSVTMGGEGLTEFMDWASAVDSFNSFEDLFADMNNSMDFWGVGPL